ncbi:MAG: hypothetical protein HY579_02690 [Nitrospinae bacterium]|nr:hypothetical protein [Nitrospinota bacterium]
MIGFLKPYKMELLLKDCLYYKLYYCSICKQLTRNNFRAYAFLNSYEGTLLAMLYNEMAVRDAGAVKERCTGLPIAKVAVLAPGNEAVELGAFISLLAFQIKFQDDLADESGFWISLYNNLLLRRLRKTFSRQGDSAKKFNIDMDHVRSGQEDLDRLEKDPGARDIEVFLERWAALFSYIMTQPFKGKIDGDRHQALALWFNGLGKIVNLMDAMTDIHQDLKAGKFNLLLRTEPGPRADNDEWLNAAYQKYFKTIQDKRAELLALLPRLGLSESLPVAQNILTHCLDKEMVKVFESMVLRKENQERLLFNCKEF